MVAVTTMRCRRCRTTIDYPAQDLGRQFDCTGCGRPGLYGYGLAEGEGTVDPIPMANDASIPFAAVAAVGPLQAVGEAVISDPTNPVPAAPRRTRFTIVRVLKIAGATALILFMLFGLVRKGAKLGRIVGPAVTWATGGEAAQPSESKP